jgi:hypothetical protein
MNYDMRFRYRVECGAFVAYADSRPRAVAIAAGLQVHDDKLVVVTRQHGKPMRWSVSIFRGLAGHVPRLSELYCDGVPDDSASRRRHALAALIEREEQRRRGRHAAIESQPNVGKTGRAKGIVCFDPVRPFASAAQVERWLNLSNNACTIGHSLKYRKGRACGYRFAYATDILQQAADGTHQHSDELIDAAKAAIAMAAEAYAYWRGNNGTGRHGISGDHQPQSGQRIREEDRAELQGLRADQPGEAGLHAAADDAVRPAPSQDADAALHPKGEGTV